MPEHNEPHHHSKGMSSSPNSSGTSPISTGSISPNILAGSGLRNTKIDPKTTKQRRQTISLHRSGSNFLSSAKSSAKSFIGSSAASTALDIVDGVYFGTLFYTRELVDTQSNKKEEINILLDPKYDFLPIVVLDRINYNSVRKEFFPTYQDDFMCNLPSECSADMNWLLQVGSNENFFHSTIQKLATSIAYHSFRSVSDFRKSFIRSANSLIGQMNNHTIGVMFDRPIKFPYDIILFLSVCEISDRNIFPGRRWIEISDFEHRVQQKYFSDNSSPSSIETIKFADLAIQYQVKLRNMRIIPQNATFVGHLCFLPTCNGVKIMIEDSNNRCMIPHVEICKNHPDNNEKRWIQSFYAKGNVPDSKLLKSVKTFSQKFEKAIESLKNQFGISSLGTLYDREFIEIDENGKLLMIVFISIAEDQKLRVSKRKCVWRKLETFDVIYHWTFFPKLYELFLGRIQTLESQLQVHNESKCPTDEIIRKNIKSTPSAKFFRAEKYWEMIKWSSRLYYWLISFKNIIKNNNTCNINSTQEGTFCPNIMLHGDAMSTFQFLIKIVREEIGKPSSSWENIEQKLSNYEEEQLKQLSLSKAVTKKKSWLDIEEEKWKSFQLVSFDFDCRIEELGDQVMSGYTKDVMCVTLVHDMLEEALVTTVDAVDVKEVRCIVDFMVEMIQITDDLINITEINLNLEKACSDIYDCRMDFTNEFSSYFGSLLSIEQRHYSDDGVLECPLAYDQIIRQMISRFSTHITKFHSLYRMIDGVQDCVDVRHSICKLDKEVERRRTLFLVNILEMQCFLLAGLVSFPNRPQQD